MWTEIKTFMPLDTELQELRAAVLERYEALRYVLQTYHSADMESSNLTSFQNYAKRYVPFTDPLSAAANMHSGSMQIFQRSATSSNGLYYGWCKTPNLVDGSTVEYGNSTSNMFDRTQKYSGSINDYGGSRGSRHNNIFYDIIDDLKWFCDHAFYIGVRGRDITPVIYNFSTGMGARNFAYGDVSQMP